MFVQSSQLLSCVSLPRRLFFSFLSQYSAIASFLTSSFTIHSSGEIPTQPIRYLVGTVLIQLLSRLLMTSFTSRPELVLLSHHHLLLYPSLGPELVSYS